MLGVLPDTIRVPVNGYKSLFCVFRGNCYNQREKKLKTQNCGVKSVLFQQF